MDCVRASDMCNQNSQCSSRYRIMRQCLAGKDSNTMLANKECQAALEVLQESPLYDCRCKRGMKKELQCLQNYWSIHMGLTEGKDLGLKLSHVTFCLFLSIHGVSRAASGSNSSYMCCI